MNSLVYLLALWAITTTYAAPSEDLIVDLPGLPGPITSTHYSGYLNATDGRFLHYWFVESQRDPSSDPLMLWLNGGPGCSSLLGSLTELGPYIISANGVDLVENDYSWNKIANIVFLESPACTGFSYDVDGNCTNSDDLTSLQNYLALQSFFQKFPEYDGRDFYIAGESYAGVYIPTLIERILNGMDEYFINLQGYAIGNGIMSNRFNTNSLMFFLRYHALIDDRLWRETVDLCCDGGIESEATCNFAEKYETDVPCQTAMSLAAVTYLFGGFDAYNIYGPCEHEPDQTSTKLYRREADLLAQRSRARIEFPSPVENRTCGNSFPQENYLNLPEVRDALHIPDSVDEWSECMSVPKRTRYEETYTNVKPQFELMTQSLSKGLVFNGDIDSVCNFLGNEWEVRNLSLAIVNEAILWHVEGQLGGYVTEFQNLSFVTVRGAGHMVPEDKPVEALHMIQSFIEGTPIA